MTHISSPRPGSRELRLYTWYGEHARKLWLEKKIPLNRMAEIGVRWCMESEEKPQKCVVIWLVLDSRSSPHYTLLFFSFFSFSFNSKDFLLWSPRLRSFPILTKSPRKIFKMLCFPIFFQFHTPAAAWDARRRKNSLWWIFFCCVVRLKFLMCFVSDELEARDFTDQKWNLMCFILPSVDRCLIAQYDFSPKNLSPHSHLISHE